MKRTKRKTNIWAVVITIKGKPAYTDGPYTTRQNAREVVQAEKEDLLSYPEIDHSEWKFTVVKMYNLLSRKMAEAYFNAHMAQ